MLSYLIGFLYTCQESVNIIHLYKYKVHLSILAKMLERLYRSRCLMFLDILEIGLLGPNLVDRCLLPSLIYKV